jgi:hypothetical protein
MPSIDLEAALNDQVGRDRGRAGAAHEILRGRSVGRVSMIERLMRDVGASMIEDGSNGVPSLVGATKL